MRANPVDLIGGFYQDDSLPWACQDTVNWIPEAAEAQGTRTPSILRDAPGLRPKVQVGTGPIRGMRNVEGKLLVVSGTTLYQISNGLVAIPRGTIPGTGMVSMAHNSRSGGNQVTIVNGYAGYVYDTNALTLTRITDAGYPGAFVVDFVDGYMAQIEPLRRYWFHSELTQALDFNTLDRYPAEGQPDALVTLLVDHREVWVFGERTIEPFVNVGTLTNTFARASNTVIEQGCSAKFSPAKLDNSIFWLDDLGIVRRAQGYTPARVSTSAIEQAIADLDWSRAFGFTITENGHAIYYLTFPDGYTFGYDITTGLWHRRASYGLDRWRVSAVAYWNGEYVCGDFQQGLLYALDWDYPYDGSLPHVRERVTGVTHDNQNRVLVPYAELVVDNGRAIVEPVDAPAQPAGPTITGDLPNGRVGDVVAYSYTLGAGTPPYTVTLVSGALPTGLTINEAGEVSGTLTAIGSFSWTLRNTDANGLWAELPDTATVDTVVGKWWLTAGAHAGKVWVSDSLEDWTGAVEVDRSPFIDPQSVGVGGGGYYQLTDNTAVMVNSDGEVEFVNGLDISGTITPTVSAPLPAGAYRVRVLAGVIFVFSYNGSATYYAYDTTDVSPAWATRTTPDGPASDIGLINSRWVMACTSGVGSWHYSDDAGEPTTWVTGSGPLISEPSAAMISMGNKAARYVSGRALATTTDGASWTSSNVLPDGGTGTSLINFGCHGYDGADTVIAGDTNGSYLFRSADKGVSWTAIAYENVQRIDCYEGLWVVCGASGPKYSTDGGLTYTACANLPVTPNPFSNYTFVTPIVTVVAP